MKKLLSLTLIICLIATCVIALASCNSQENKMVGTYEMVSISGTITYNGTTVQLEEDLYEYYRIILNKDGSCAIESKGKANTSKVEQEGTWEYENDTLKIKTNSSGITVVEEMQWKDGTITYNAEQNASGMKIKMSLILEKQ